MFSANENIELRRHKRRIVDLVEETIEEDLLDMGVQTMVMEVACRDPGCVPLETCIIIVFPKMNKELLVGLKESNGGSFKTKILMPMKMVTKQDVLEALPPQFKGGLRTTQRLCAKARDLMFGQIGQMFEDTEGRRLLAKYLQASLDDYMQNDCTAPPPGEEYDEEESRESNALLKESEKNVVIRRKVETASSSTANSMETKTKTTSSPSLPASAKSSGVGGGGSGTGGSLVGSVTQRRQQSMASSLLNSSAAPQFLAQLSEREHAPGIRKPSCPCCDPDNPTHVIDSLMQL